MADQVEDLRYPQYERMEKFSERYKMHPDLAYGFSGLDRATAGLHAGEITVIGARTGEGKAVDVHTPIPIPDGWKEMGDLQAGDMVFGEHGQPVTVTHAHLVDLHPESYRLTFDDKTTLLACADHQWLTFDASARAAIPNAGIQYRYPDRWAFWKSARNKSGLIRTTKQISQSLIIAEGYHNHSIPVSGALVLPDIPLAVDPFVLGVWLGDGSSSSGSARVSADKKNGDQQLIRQELAKRGYPTTDIADKYSFGVPALLRKIFDIKAGPFKMVPPEYLRASISQRLDLLRGLMITNGTVTMGGQVSFDNTSQGLVEAVRELAASLGQKPRATELSRRTSVGRRVWRAYWTPTIDVFGVGRKSLRIHPRGVQGIRHCHRMIVSCVRVDPVPMRCISVDNPSGLYLAGKAMIPTHNSTVAIQMVSQVAAAGRKVVYFSNEMRREAIWAKIASRELLIPVKKIMTGELLLHEKEKLESYFRDRLARYPLVVYDQREGADPLKIISILQKEKPEVFVIDHIQHVEAENQYAKERETLSTFMKTIKAQVDKNNYTAILLSQCNRNVEGRLYYLPYMSDLMGSSAIEADADVVLLLAWPHKTIATRDIDGTGAAASHNPRQKGRVFAEDEYYVELAKNRYGEVGFEKLSFHPYVSLFRETEKKPELTPVEAPKPPEQQVLINPKERG